MSWIRCFVGVPFFAVLMNQLLKDEESPTRKGAGSVGYSEGKHCALRTKVRTGA